MSTAAQVQSYATHPTHIAARTRARLLRGERVGSARDNACIQHLGRIERPRIVVNHWHTPYMEQVIRITPNGFEPVGPLRIRVAADTVTSKRRYRELIGSRPIVNGAALASDANGWHDAGRLQGAAVFAAWCAECDTSDAAARRCAGYNAMRFAPTPAHRRFLADRLERAGSHPRRWTHTQHIPEREALTLRPLPYIGDARGESLLTLIEACNLDTFCDDTKIGAHLAGAGLFAPVTGETQRRAFEAVARVWATGAQISRIEASVFAWVAQRAALAHEVSS